MLVAQPFPHAPFRDPSADLFAPSGAVTARAEFPPILDSPPSLPMRAPPFPTFQHRHTSPYPMSFSALGAPIPNKPLHTSTPPPAPKVDPAPLPRIRTDAPTLVAVSSRRNLSQDPHERDRRKHRPEAMIKLAPPADDGYEAIRIVQLDGESDTPRRSPVVTLDLNNMDSSPSVRIERSNSEGKRRQKHEADVAKRRSMGPPPRPVRSNTSYPASTPSSVRMEPSRSADSRARTRAAMPIRAHTSSPYAVPFPTGTAGSRSSSDLTTTPVRDAPSSSTDSESPDLGGPDGLEAKVVLLGSQGVGKTSLILRFTTRTFAPMPAPATIGSSLHTRKLVHGGIRVKLQIWDTAGQERFRSMAPIYYRGAHVCVLVYDISDRQSFEDVRSWLEELGRTVPKETMIYVVGSKVDLERKRAVTLDEARSSIRNWTRPPPPPTALLSPPPQRSLFRSSSTSNRLESPPSITPTRSYSHGALAAYNVPLPPSATASAVPTPARHPSIVRSDTATTTSSSIQPLSLTMAAPEPILNTRSRPAPALRIIATSPRSPRRVAFPTLQSPSVSVTGTSTEHAVSMSPTSASGHGISGGRFSISGVLGLSRTESMSGAVLNLARLAEENPIDRDRIASSSRLSPPQTATRVRTESTPLLGGPSSASARRKSEDWSGRSWRMGGGPGAAEQLGEFGASIKKKESEELLAHGAGGRRGSSASGMSLGGALSGDESTSSKDAAAAAAAQQQRITRSRGGSLGRDSRLYPSSEEEDSEWGVEVSGVRLGECSSLSGAGVEALFKSISSLLVQKKDKIERERQIRRKGSVMLVDPTRDINTQAGNKGRFGCCA